MRQGRSEHRNSADRVSSDRHQEKLSAILRHATDVFHEKGYEGASMRDLSRASGMSLAGLYHYFESKEKLLYLIQKHTFETILERLQSRLKNADDPEQRIRVVVSNHLEYFLANQRAMKVLSHEDEVLTGVFGEQVREIKRRYYQVCRDLIKDLTAARGLDLNPRIAVLSLFGMMNWIYTWYRPRADDNAATLARDMGNIFLRGILGASTEEITGPEAKHLNRTQQVSLTA